jgi:phospholipid/cholesterol/gamma-HCH transport system permease protein
LPLINPFSKYSYNITIFDGVTVVIITFDNLVKEERVNLAERLGVRVTGFLHDILTITILFYLSLKEIWTERNLGQRDFIRQVLLQVYFTGVQSTVPVIVLALGMGAFVMVEGMTGIGALSGAENLGEMITVVILREIGPVLTGGVVIVRSVTAIASELGSMRVQREIEALEVMGISPIKSLVAPRLFGGVASLAALNVVFSAVSLFGGFVVSQFLITIPVELFFRSVTSALEPIDIFSFTVKSIIGGTGIVLIACYRGMSVGSSSTEVHVAVSRAALESLVFLILFNGLVSFITILNTESAKVFEWTL